MEFLYRGGFVVGKSKNEKPAEFPGREHKMLEVWFFIVLYSPHSRQNMTKPPTLQGFRQDTASTVWAWLWDPSNVVNAWSRT